jgi:hypothetical protein
VEKFVGSDIMMELFQNGELQKQVEKFVVLVCAGGCCKPSFMAVLMASVLVCIWRTCINLRKSRSKEGVV